MDFVGKCCIVTGSAMGIGKAVAEGLLERGAKCVIADINWKANKSIRLVQNSNLSEIARSAGPVPILGPVKDRSGPVLDRSQPSCTSCQVDQNFG